MSLYLSLLYWPDDVARFFPIDLPCFGYEKSDPCLGYKVTEEKTQISLFRV